MGNRFCHANPVFSPPEHRERRFRAPLCNFDFHHDRAIYRDVRRKIEITLDQSAMHIIWDAMWDQ